MASPKHRAKSVKRIAIAIEMDQPYPHHLGCYSGILQYAASKDDWHAVVDPFVLGVSRKASIREYDGIVGRITKKARNAARAAGIPVVNHWVNSPVRRELPSVLPDCRKGCRLAAEHFLARGFRQFGYVGSARDQTRELHLAGFEPPIRQRGLKVAKFHSPLKCEANPKVFGRFYTGLNQWLAGLTWPTALMVPSEPVALYVVQICRELELRIPQDVGLVVGRENPTICMQSSPTLSCIEDDNELIGYRAAELLDQIMLGQIEAPTEPIWIEPKALRVRGSSDAFLSDDPTVSLAMRFMAEHAHEPITVEKVADAADTSKRTLQQRFAQHVGRSVHAEIMRLRVETVKRLLIDTDASLEELADENGFTDVSHMVKTFRKVASTTPGAFRRRHRTPH